MQEVADLYVVLRAVGTQFKEGMAEAGAAAEGADSKIAGIGASVAKLGLVAGAGAVLVAGAALKMSSSFDRAMEQLVTLAHVPQAELKQLGAGVLDLAGQIGFSPDSLAESLYHVESTFASTGITAAKALQLTKVAAEGAKIGNTDLTATTNALSAAVISGLPGVQNMSQAMGTMLAVVGSGDMQMQDLVDAFTTGILVVGKQYGATLQDMGAALADFADNQIKGQKAATELRMAIMDLTKQSAPGVKALEQIGIQQGQLAKDMQTGGLNKAIIDLHDHLNAAGITGARVGQVLEDAFTKKASAPLAVLLGTFNNFESKFPEMDRGAKSFGKAWQDTANLMSTKVDKAKSNVESLFVGLGHMLQPLAKKILDFFNNAFSWAETHKKVIVEIGSVIKTFLVGALVIAGAALASFAAEAVIAAAPFVLLAGAIGLLVKGFMSLYDHNAKFRAFVQEIVTGFRKDATEAVHWLMQAFQDAKQVISDVINAVVGFYQDHQAAIDQMVSDVQNVLTQVGQTFQAAFDAVKAIVQTAVKIIEDLWSRFGSHLWQHIVTAWNTIKQVIRGALEVIKGIFELVTGILTGHWSKAWKGITDIVVGAWNVISGLVKGAINFISTIIGAGMAAISAVWGFVWHGIETMAKSAWNGIRVVLVGLFDYFVMLPVRIVEKFADAYMWFFRVGENIIHSLWNGVLNVIGGLWNAVEQIPLGFWNILKGLYNTMLTVGYNIVVGIWNGIAGMAQWLYNKAMGFAKGIWHSITSFLGIGSPSKLMRDTVGKHIVTGIAQGIQENQHLVYQALQQLANGTASAKFTVGAFSAGASNPLARSLAGSMASSVAGSGALAGGSGNTYIQVQVQGQVIDSQGLFKAMQTAVQQHGGRNPSTGLVFTR